MTRGRRYDIQTQALICFLYKYKITGCEEVHGVRRKIGFIFFLLLQMLIFVLPCQAEVTWHDVSRSMNSSFSGGQGFSMKNAIALLGILVFILVAVIFHLFWPREEKEKKDSNQISWRPLNQQQKRKWFRLPTSAEFEWIPAENAYIVKKSQYKKDRLVDISGGGLCFTTAEKLNSGDQIILLLNTGGGKNLILNGEVLRVEEETGQDKAINKVSVKFGNLLRGERDRIVSFIMNRQRDTIQDSRARNS